MANVATMGPPPSPKEPRRSGRRPIHSGSASKSPAGSPSSESAPKPKENPTKPNHANTNGSNNRKRVKNDDGEEPLEELHKNGVNGIVNGAARSRRKTKDKEKVHLMIEIPNGDVTALPELADENAREDNGEQDEDSVTRCICGSTGEDDNDAGGFMAQCEDCGAWQHGECMGYSSAEHTPLHYFCELCRPDLYPELLKKHAKRNRQPSANSHHGGPRSSRSHSPAVSLKPTKRRNTMNSRDAAYEESVLALLEATASEAAGIPHDPPPPPTPVTPAAANGETNGHAKSEPLEEVPPNARKKRKRTDDDAASVKRTRSASITSERPPPPAPPRDPTPLTTPAAKPPPLPAAPVITAPKSSGPRRRGGGRKVQTDLASVDGDEPSASTAPARRPGNPSRAKVNGNNEGNSRRPQANGAGGANTGMSTASRAYHNSHAFATSQQAPFTSWNLPDYLAHLESMLPTSIPQPLEVRVTAVDSNGRQSQERCTERGVKVRWPSKRMSVGDMNKRVRALVEWVGREQASTLERTRRRDALEKAAKEAAQESSMHHSAHDRMDVDPSTSALDTRIDTNGIGHADPATKVPDRGAVSTMKIMEELMEELIRFQERFGPGAKSKERDRRTSG